MQKFIGLKKSFLLLGLLMPIVWQGTYAASIMDGYSIVIKVGNVQSSPKGSTIQASVNGHMLTVAFTENL